MDFWREAETAKLPDIFTLDARRHGGKTELEEAELTEGQGLRLPGPASLPGLRKKEHDAGHGSHYEAVGLETISEQNSE